MSRSRRWRSLAMTLAYFNVVFNLLLYSGNHARGSLVATGCWLVAALGWTGLVVSERRRKRVAAQRHQFLMRPLPRLPDPFQRTPYSVLVLGSGERIIPIPQMGGARKPQVPARTTCSHWPRDAVNLSDGTTVAYICRRCDHDWADENYVTEGVEW